MPVPFAAARGVFAGRRRSSADAGKTEISAPVSAKYARPVWSQTVNVLPCAFPLTELTARGRYERNFCEVGGVGENGDVSDCSDGVGGPA